METVYGNLDEVSGGPNDNFWLLDQYDTTRYPLPRLFSACGTEDGPVFGVHQRLMEEFRKRGGDVTELSCKGIHDFHFWNKALEQAMYDWLPKEES